MRLLCCILSMAVCESVYSTTITINTNACALPLLSSQVYHAQNGNPIASGTVSTINPPLFGWTYVPYPTNYEGDQSSKVFRLDISTNGFVTTNTSITTSNNFYNTIAPITNDNGSTFIGTVSWRVTWISNDFTTVLLLGPTNTFTLSTSATNWDRSMLADSNYLYTTLSPHPHMMLNAGNKDAMYQFMLTNVYDNGRSWSYLSNEVVNAITNSWWNNEDVFTNTATPSTFLYVQYYLWEAGFIYQLSGSPILLSSNMPGMMDIWNRYYLRNGFDRSPVYGGSVAYTQQSQWALAVDYIWPLMNATQRSNAVAALSLSAAFYVNEDCFFEGSAPDISRTYPFTNRLVNADASFKGGDSHQRYDIGVGLLMTMAIWADSTNAQTTWPYYINYMLGKKDPYDLDEGRAYMQAGFPEIPGNTGPDLATVMTFPEAKLWLNPLWLRFTALPSYMEPVFYRGLLEPWGDLGFGIGGNDTMFYNEFNTAPDVAKILNNGSILQQWKRQNPTAFVEAGGSPEYEMALPYYFTNPPQADWPTNVYIDSEWGYAVLSSHQPSDFASFTNSVWFVTQARPDAHINHGMYADGSYQFDAYGAHINIAGAGSYSRHPMLASGQVMVQGMGPAITRANPTASTYARFVSVTNSSDFAYIQSDTKNAYPLTPLVIAQQAGNLLMDYYTTNNVGGLTGMDRKMIFPHHKYIVEYDSMTSSTNYTFQWLWHFMETNNASVNTNGCSFSYTTTNMFNNGVTTNYVYTFVDPTSMTLTNMSGTNNWIINPFTHEVLTDINFYNIPEPPPSGNIWIYNKTATNNWHFGFVIYPSPPGQSAPTFTRNSDTSFELNDGVNDDVITINAATITMVLNGQAATYQPAPFR